MPAIVIIAAIADAYFHLIAGGIYYYSGDLSDSIAIAAVIWNILSLYTELSLLYCFSFSH